MFPPWRFYSNENKKKGKVFFLDRKIFVFIENK